MSFSVAVATRITAEILEGYQRPKNPKDTLLRVAEKPLLRILMATKEDYGSAGWAAGADLTTADTNIREYVLGDRMSSQSGFYHGTRGDGTLVFKSSSGGVQTICPTGHAHAGWSITHDELNAAGIHVTNNKATTTTAERNVLIDFLETRKAEYTESIDTMRNLTLFLDGTQDSDVYAGLKSVLTDDPTTGTVLGISRANAWWRHVADTGVGGANAKLQYSKANQTLSERLISVFKYDLPRYGGRPDACIAGRDVCDAVEREARAKGLITQSGWADKKTNIEVKGIKIGNLEIEHEPMLDEQGESKRIYAWDTRRLRLRPQREEWGKVIPQNQPPDQLVMLTSTLDRAALTCRQMDCNYVGEME